jgi:hypothetical protein
MRVRKALAIAAALFVLTSATALAAPLGWPKGWSEIKTLTPSASLMSSPSIAIDSQDNLHMVWADNSSGTMQVRYLVSDRRGTTLGPIKTLSPEGAEARNPVIGVGPGDVVHIAWEEAQGMAGRIRYLNLNEGRTSDVANSNALFGNLDLAIDVKGEVNLVWADGRDGNSEIYWARLAASGDLNVDPTRLTVTDGNSRLPEAVVGPDGTLTVAWREESTIFAEAMYLEIPSGTRAPATAPRNLGKMFSRERSRGPLPLVLASGKIAFLLSKEIPQAGTEIFLIKPTADGEVADTRLTTAVRDSFSPAGAVDGQGNLHLAWIDFRKGPTSPNLYYRNLEGGSDTQLTVSALDEMEGAAVYLPVIVVDRQGSPHIFWRGVSEDNRFEIQMMDTVTPAVISRWAAMGVNEDHPLASFGMMLLGSASMSVLFFFMDSVSTLFVIVGGFWLLRKVRLVQSHFVSSYLLLFSGLYAWKLPGNPLAAQPRSSGTAYSLVCFAIATLLTLTFMRLRKVRLEDEVSTIYASVVWIFWFNFLLLIPTIATTRLGLGA